MRDDRDMNYGNFSRSYRQEGHNNHQHWRFHGREHAHLGDTYNEPGEHYRLQQSRQYGREGGREGVKDDRYKEMYTISNYSNQVRPVEYGLPKGAENDLDRVEYFPYQEGPYAGRPRIYTYKQGYNPNYDNPEEGDRYRDFDSRGNHGFRHNRGYSSDGGFSQFGDDHYGDPNDVSTHYNGRSGGRNR